MTLQCNKFLCPNLPRINLQGRWTSLRVLLSVMSNCASKELIIDVNPIGNSILIFLSEFFLYLCGNSGKPASCGLFKHFSWGWNQPGAGAAFLAWSKGKHSGESSQLFTVMWSKMLIEGQVTSHFMRGEPCKLPVHLALFSVPWMSLKWVLPDIQCHVHLLSCLFPTSTCLGF